MGKKINPEKKLKKLKIVLPKPPKPAGAYVPFVISKKVIYVSGQLPWVNGKLKYTGKVGDKLSLEQGKECAKICGINALAVLKNAVKKLSKVKKIIKIQGTVNSTADFFQHSLVVNGASELMLEVFGERGKHSRAVSGTNVLPLDAPIMIELIAEIK